MSGGYDDRKDWGICEIHFPQGWPRRSRRVECDHGWYTRPPSQENATESLLCAQEELLRAVELAASADEAADQEEHRAEEAMEKAVAVEAQAVAYRKAADAAVLVVTEKREGLKAAKEHERLVLRRRAKASGLPSTHGSKGLAPGVEPPEGEPTNFLAAAGLMLGGEE